MKISPGLVCILVVRALSNLFSTNQSFCYVETSETNCHDTILYYLVRNQELRSHEFLNHIEWL